MPIIAYLGTTVKDYHENGKRMLEELELCCPNHAERTMSFHSKYERTIKETGEKVVIHILICHKCGMSKSVLPDFLLPNKHYSAAEVESVLLQAVDEAVYDIDTPASISTVRRWLGEMDGEGGKLAGIVSGLKTVAMEQGRAVSEVTLAGLRLIEQVGEFVHALLKIHYSGNLLGYAGVYLSGRSP